VEEKQEKQEKITIVEDVEQQKGSPRRYSLQRNATAAKRHC